MVAAKLATLKRGDIKTQRESSGAQICAPSMEQAADMLSVGKRSVTNAKQVLEHGSKEIIEAVEQGQLPVSFTAKVVTEEPDKRTQTQLLKKGGKQALKDHTGVGNDKSTAYEIALKAVRKLSQDEWERLKTER
jgi:hypothetical protein